MKVAFRVDASREIGTGHVMRCLTLARGLKTAGADNLFICADLNGNLVDHISQEGFAVHRLPRESNTRWDVDAAGTKEAFTAEDFAPDLLVVDHYALDYRWEKAIAPLVHKLVVIDDLANRGHACDILIDQNLPDDRGARYRDFVSEDTLVLTGPRYALLRTEFAEARRRNGVREAGLRRLLVMFGGIDDSGETLKALRGLAPMAADIAIDVIVSAHNREIEQIQRYVAELDNTVLHIQPKDVARIMSDADFALGAGGITLWERCALRLPSASTLVAENQRAQIRHAQDADLTLLAGEASDTDDVSYREIVHLMRRNPSLLARMSVACGKAVDGQGLDRIVRHLVAEPIRVRSATTDDCLRLYEWRNSEPVRQYSGNPEAISLPEHREWFQRAVDNASRILLIGEMSGQQIGVVRFDLEDDRATVSIYLNPDFIGSGVGGRLLAASERHMLALAPRIRRIHARVLDTNIGSRRMFERAGYQPATMELVKNVWREGR